MVSKTSILVLVSVLAIPTGLSAQHASPILSADDWSRALARRLVLLDTTAVAQAARAWPLSKHEFNEITRDSSLSPRFGRLGLGIDGRAGAARAGTMQRVGDGYVYPGPRLQPNRSTVLLRAEAGVTITPGIAVGAEAALNDHGASLRSAYGSWNWRALDGWIGRRTVGFGVGPGNGIVLDERTAFTGGGVSLRDGVRIPIAGRLYADILLARMRRSGLVEHPWFTATRLTLAPHRNLAIGLNRAAIFGGDESNSITPGRIALMLLGFSDVAGKDSDFENQVASLDVLWRVPSMTLPLAVHAEYGTDDTGFAFLHVPAIIAGVELLRVPGLDALTVGTEAVYFSRRCCSYPPWYRHGALADGWTDRGRLLAHPLGGDGSEFAFTAGWLERNQTISTLRLYRRQRGVDNLFAPDREGESVGFELGAVVRRERVRFEFKADAERADGWEATGLRGMIWFSF